MLPISTMKDVQIMHWSLILAGPPIDSQQAEALIRRNLDGSGTDSKSLSFYKLPNRMVDHLAFKRSLDQRQQILIIVCQQWTSLLACSAFLLSVSGRLTIINKKYSFSNNMFSGIKLLPNKE